MKIAIVLGPFYAMPPTGCGAVERVWHELSQALCDAGHEVVLIGKGANRARTTSRSGGLTVVALRGYTATGSIWLDLLKDFLYGLQVRRLIGVADVVVANSFWLPVVLRLPMRGAPKILVHVARYPKHQMWLYTSADAIQAISTAVANEVVRQCPKLKTKIAVLPYPIDGTIFKPPAATRDYSRALTVLYAGRLHPEKGIHLLIEAFRVVVERRPALTLRLVGPVSTELGGGGTQYLDRLKKLAHDLPVEFVQPISDPRLLVLEYQNAHCFCYPSLAEKGEAFGLAALEAMATGLPVVVSDLACFRDFVDPGVDGLTFDHRARFPIEELARALDQVVGNPSFAMQLGKRALKKAGQYAFDDVAARYVALVESLHDPVAHDRDAQHV